MHKPFFFSALASILLSSCLVGGDDKDSNTTPPPSGTLNPAFVGDWQFTYRSSSEQELWAWSFGADGSMHSCRWEAEADGTNPSPQLCLRGTWSDVGAAATLWPTVATMAEQYPQFGFAQARVVLTAVDSTAPNMRWQPGWLLSARGDTLTYLGDIMTWSGGPNLYGDSWTSEEDSFTLQEDGTCTMVMEGESCDCSWENSEGGRTTISCTQSLGGGSSSTSYLQGYLSVTGSTLYVLDLEDPAHFVRE